MSGGRIVVVGLEHRDEVVQRLPGTVALAVENDLLTTVDVEGQDGQNASCVDRLPAGLSDGDPRLLMGGRLHEHRRGTGVQTDTGPDDGPTFFHGGFFLRERRGGTVALWLDHCNYNGRGCRCQRLIGCASPSIRGRPPSRRGPPLSRRG